MDNIHKEYKTYPETEKYYYEDEVVYERFKDKKVIDFCDHCGHKTGSHIEKIGINKLGYIKKKYKKNLSSVTRRAFFPKIVDSILGYNPLDL